MLLTVEDIAARLRCTPRWVRERWVSGWLASAGDPRVPRVSILRTGRRGRPRYVVDRDSFERWACPALAQAA